MDYRKRIRNKENEKNKHTDFDDGRAIVTATSE